MIRRNGAYDLSLNQYYDLFKSDKKIIGEASTFYIFSKNAAKEIYNFNSEAKIIIMLRDLVDLVYSLHSQFVFSGDEVVEDFKQALDLAQNRLNGIDVPNQTTVVNKLFYTNNILDLPCNIKSFSIRKACFSIFINKIINSMLILFFPYSYINYIFTYILFIFNICNHIFSI